MSRSLNRSEVMEIIKTRIDVGDREDMIITYIEEIGRRILHYCQRNNIPSALNWVWASMVIDALKIDYPADYDNDDGAMSVKIGDTTVGPANKNGVTATSKLAIDQIVLNYKADLHRYRRLRW